MNITQTFYDNLASQYDKLFFDWETATQEQAVILDRLFAENGVDKSAHILDCACGIGTQAIGLASIGYHVTGSDISEAEIAEAQKRAAKNKVRICFEHADFCSLSDRALLLCQLFIHLCQYGLMGSYLINELQSVTLPSLFILIFKLFLSYHLLSTFDMSPSV